MTPEERSLLERTYQLTEENNDMLKSIRRSGRFSLALRIGYWAVIILLSVGAYYVIQPTIDAARELFSAPPSSDPTSLDSQSLVKELLGL